MATSDVYSAALSPRRYRVSRNAPRVKGIATPTAYTIATVTAATAAICIPRNNACRPSPSSALVSPAILPMSSNSRAAGGPVTG